MSEVAPPKPLAAEALAWHCDAASLPFETTEEVDPASGILGQPSALEALTFGLQCHAQGQNVYVRGVTGTGRLTMVRRLLEEVKAEPRRQCDRCYVHNFARPDRPRLVTLEPGTARAFRHRMRE
ncbi:MAG: AAA family ATPase, partial [Gammaproteobacteria bacterium]|nr:AAA family ATPase [Gammaproteobacteria bacterium]